MVVKAPYQLEVSSVTGSIPIRSKQHKGHSFSDRHDKHAVAQGDLIITSCQVSRVQFSPGLELIQKQRTVSLDKKAEIIFSFKGLILRHKKAQNDGG